MLAEEIVTKSSGQFIYASIVIKFLSNLRSNPVIQLDVVRGLQPAGSLTPFAQLDALYSHILSQVEDFDLTASVLATRLIKNYSCSDISYSLNISGAAVFSALADLSSVINYGSSTGYFVVYLHASLPDFLLDRTRSGQYHVDLVKWATHIAINFARKQKIIPPWRKYLMFLLLVEKKLTYTKILITSAICSFMHNPTPELREALITFHNEFQDRCHNEIH